MRQENVHGNVNVKSPFRVSISSQLDSDRPFRRIMTRNSIFFSRLLSLARKCLCFEKKVWRYDGGNARPIGLDLTAENLGAQDFICDGL